MTRIKKYKYFKSTATPMIIDSVSTINSINSNTSASINHQLQEEKNCKITVRFFNGYDCNGNEKFSEILFKGKCERIPIINSFFEHYVIDFDALSNPSNYLIRRAHKESEIEYNIFQQGTININATFWNRFSIDVNTIVYINTLNKKIFFDPTSPIRGISIFCLQDGDNVKYHL
ncbi:hypothetical protein PVAND_017623 [Polypedilum vanderplanki]|uniref:Uncharacterized protein n=1 Tax=Polypedilum vanderplanki TaxID=319348 RepID=A0A9J6B944_POLVA|nr:hypothetical protein PVAND_017623 [Polypedilum vanderplanki]